MTKTLAPCAKSTKPGVGPGLIGADDYRARRVFVRGRPAPGYCRAVFPTAVDGRSRAGRIPSMASYFRHVDDADIEPYAAPHAGHLRRAERGTEHLKGSVLLHRRVGRGTSGELWRQRDYPKDRRSATVPSESECAQPQEGGQIGDVVGVEDG